MAIYALAVRTSNTTAANAAFELMASANFGFRLVEIGFTQNAANASVYGLGKSATAGGTPTTPVTVLAEDIGNTTVGNSNTALAWTTGPVAPTAFYRRVSVPALVGAGIIWTFPRGLTVLKAITQTLVLWNIAGPTSALDAWVVVDE